MASLGLSFSKMEIDGKPQTVTSERYVTVLKKFRTELKRRRRINFNDQWFMQDGATAHTARDSRQWLEDTFEKRVISLKTDFPWAPHSPDLNPLDFFLWGYLKDCVYRENHGTVRELKTAIVHHVERLKLDNALCARVIREFERRVGACLNRQGRHMEHLL